VRMERELAEQRQRLPHDHEAGEQSPPQTGGELGTVGEPVESELPRMEARLERQPSMPPTSIRSDRDIPSRTGGIVPPAERVPETGNKPISEGAPSRGRQPSAPASLVHGEKQPEARERWRAPEYAGTQQEGRQAGRSREYADPYEDIEVPEGFNVGAVLVAALSAVGAVALFAYLRHRSNHRRHHSLLG